MSNKYFILRGKEPVLVDLMEWARWFETADRVVAKSIVHSTTVSTVFLGLNHRFVSGRPLLFETMVFGGSLDREQWRCSTWEEAEKQHGAACAAVQSSSGHHKL